MVLQTEATPEAEATPAADAPADSTTETAPEEEKTPAAGEETKLAEEPETKETLKKHYNVLSIDGGGIRGVIPTVVIKYIEE